MAPTDAPSYCDGCVHRGKWHRRMGAWWCFVFKTFFGAGDVTACNRRAPQKSIDKRGKVEYTIGADSEHENATLLRIA